jgi:hypothetical protein
MNELADLVLVVYILLSNMQEIHWCMLLYQSSISAFICSKPIVNAVALIRGFMGLGTLQVYTLTGWY